MAGDPWELRRDTDQQKFVSKWNDNFRQGAELDEASDANDAKEPKEVLVKNTRLHVQAPEFTMTICSYDII